MSGNIWKLQDAKARFSELVREARKGEPQRVTVHGKDAVVVFDPTRFKAVPIVQDDDETLAGFIERSKKYRARNKAEELQLLPRVKMHPLTRPLPFVDDEDDSGNSAA